MSKNNVGYKEEVANLSLTSLMVNNAVQILS